MCFIKIFEDEDLSTKILNEVCSRSKPGKDKVTFKKFKEDFKETSISIKKKISNKTYKFTRFETILKTKKHYQLPRLIFKSTIRDRYVAKLMYEYLKSIYEQKGVSSGISKSRYYILQEISKLIIQKNDSDEFLYNGYIRLDIRSYYDSINRYLLKKQIYNDCQDDVFLALVDNLFLTMDMSKEKPNGYGIPQGISVSSIFAERYLNDFDKQFESKKTEVKILRYVDDILILVGDTTYLEEVKQKIIFELYSKYGLELNEDKMKSGNINNDDFEFLGTKFEHRKVSISDKQMNRVKQQLIELFKWYTKISHDGSFDVSRNVTKYDVTTKRLQETLVEKLNLLITGYFYKREKDESFAKYGWVLTSLPCYLTNLDKLKELDKYVSFLLKNYLQDENFKEQHNIKSFYMTFINFYYNKNCYNYVLDRDVIEQDDEKMYKITCNLSMVDIKKGLKYDEYDKDEFERAVEDSLKNYFKKTLYISNRNLTSDILYW